MYRFRKIESLLGKFQELESQEIYFASPEELNDPMEGYQDVFWKGDEIVWKNLITNYIKSAEHITMSILLDREKNIGERDIIVSPLIPNKAIGDDGLIQKIIRQTFSNEFISTLPSYLMKRLNPIRRNELLSYLQFIHPFVIDAISKVYIDYKFIEKPISNQDISAYAKYMPKSGNIVDLMNKTEIENKSIHDVVDILSAGASMTHQQIELLTRYNFKDSTLYSNDLFLISQFPEKYLLRLESSIYPKWYSASFLSECNNSAVWGHYGDNHKGVCLKFKTSTNIDKLEIDLIAEPGYMKKPNGMRAHEFHKISYHNKHVEIDFFRSIGRMPKATLNFLWYSDEKGKLSECAEHINKNEDEWRQKYWTNFYNSFNVKLSEWSYEKEYRLVVHGDFIDYSDVNKRKFKYDFNDLEAIIFGIKTEFEDKIKILKIIEEKCKKNNRKDFDFYQAFYSKNDGDIKVHKLSLLKFD